MSILGLFDIGKSALLASQAALGVVSNNIANANTPGYTRQDVVLDIANPLNTAAGPVGSGVTVAGIRRSFDRFLQAQLLGQQQSQGRSAALDQVWGQIEAVMNEAQGGGLSSALSDYFNAWQDVATNPSSQPQRIVLLQKANALTGAAQNIGNNILGALQGANNSIADAAGQINGLAADIALLNDKIIQQESGTAQTANELRDQRDQKLDQLSQLVGISSYEDKNGSLTVTVGMRSLVSGTGSSPLSTVTNGDGDQDLYLDGINITADVRQGRVGGLIAARDDIQTNVLTGFRRLVASISQQVNAQHRAGYGLDGSTGADFFTPLTLSTTQRSAASLSAAITDPAALTLDEYTITFNAAGDHYYVAAKQSGAAVADAAYDPSGTDIALPGMSIHLANAVTAGDRFTVSPLTNAVGKFKVAVTDPSKVAAASDAGSLPGDNSNASLIAQLANQAQGTLGGTTFAGCYGGIVSRVGAAKQTAADGLTFDKNLLSAMKNQRDSVSAVSLDEEAANLVRFQRSYEAGARMISVTDELMKTLLNL